MIGALVLALVNGTLTWPAFRDSLLSATRTSCMIAFIVLCAQFLSLAMGFTGIPNALASWVGSLELSIPALLVALTIFFVL